MTTEQRTELINQLVEHTKIPRAYYMGLSDRRLLEEIDKLRLIY